MRSVIVAVLAVAGTALAGDGWGSSAAPAYPTTWSSAAPVSSYVPPPPSSYPAPVSSSVPYYPAHNSSSWAAPTGTAPPASYSSAPAPSVPPYNAAGKVGVSGAALGALLAYLL